MKHLLQKCIFQGNVVSKLSYRDKILMRSKMLCTKIVSENDQEIPQSQTADNPVEPRGRAAQPS